MHTSPRRGRPCTDFGGLQLALAATVVHAYAGTNDTNESNDDIYNENFLCLFSSSQAVSSTWFSFFRYGGSKLD
jgi:hypothetical protein